MILAKFRESAGPQSFGDPKVLPIHEFGRALAAGRVSAGGKIPQVSRSTKFWWSLHPPLRGQWSDLPVHGNLLGIQSKNYLGSNCGPIVSQLWPNCGPPRKAPKSRRAKARTSQCMQAYWANSLCEFPSKLTLRISEQTHFANFRANSFCEFSSKLTLRISWDSGRAKRRSPAGPRCGPPSASKGNV